MGKKADLSSEEKCVIKELRNCNMTILDIAQRIKRAKSTVSTFLAKHNSDGNKRKNCGRKSALNSRDKRRVFTAATKKQLSTREVSRLLPSSVSHITIWRALKSSRNSKYVKLAKKPKLSKDNIAKRMEFSKKYQTWDKEWQKVIFSDEKNSIWMDRMGYIIIGMI